MNQGTGDGCDEGREGGIADGELDSFDCRAALCSDPTTGRDLSFRCRSFTVESSWSKGMELALTRVEMGKRGMAVERLEGICGSSEGRC